MDFASELLKVKLISDYLIDDFSNSYKVLFLISELNVCSPKDLCRILKMAKSNLAVLAGKLRLVKFIEQKKQADNQKEIIYFVTPLGREKLNNKLKSIVIKDAEKANALVKLKQILQSL